MAGLKTVDDAKKTFKVTRDVLVELSPVVRAAITGEFKEGAKQEMALPRNSNSLADFELFLCLAQAVAFSKDEAAADRRRDQQRPRPVPRSDRGVPGCGANAEDDGRARAEQRDAGHGARSSSLKRMRSVCVTWTEQAFEKLFDEVAAKGQEVSMATNYTINFTFLLLSTLNRDTSI